MGNHDTKVGNCVGKCSGQTNTLTNSYFINIYMQFPAQVKVIQLSLGVLLKFMCTSNLTIIVFVGNLNVKESWNIV